MLHFKMRREKERGRARKKKRGRDEEKMEEKKIYKFRKK